MQSCSQAGHAGAKQGEPPCFFKTAPCFSDFSVCVFCFSSRRCSLIAFLLGRRAALMAPVKAARALRKLERISMARIKCWLLSFRRMKFSRNRMLFIHTRLQDMAENSLKILLRREPFWIPPRALAEAGRPSLAASPSLAGISSNF